MEKINLIQTALFSIDSTKFEVLCGKFLYSKGEFEELPIPNGKAVAKNRPSKGHPDALSFQGGKYHFLVCTAIDNRSAPSSIVKKIEKDLRDSLDIKKTDITPDKIEVIHVCVAGKITAKIHSQIIKKFKAYSCLIKLWDGYVIASDIYHYYPPLAKIYLNIDVERKVVLPLRDYLDSVGSSSESMLINPFLKPDNFQDIQNKFEENKILILSGISGTGKTRIAVELLLNHISGKNKRRAYCIKSNAVASSEVIELDLSPGKENSLLIDDAGRETTNLIRVLERLRQQPKYIGKLILTTRDYSLSDVEKVLKEFSINYTEHEIQPHSKEFIENVILEQGDISIPQSVKLSTIARGRVRIAIMGTQLLKESPEVDLNAEVIYDRFFKSIADDKTELKDIRTQKLLALLYFFKYVDFQDEDCVKDRFSRFKLNGDKMKEKAIPLKYAEFLDEFDDIYRVGDQEIGFYHFFKVFIKEKLLPLEQLLTKENLKYTIQLQETLGECFKIFEGAPALDRTQDIIEKTFYKITDEYIQFDFLKVFAKQLPHIAYNHVEKVIHSTSKEVDSPSYNVGNYQALELRFERPKVISFLHWVISENIFQAEPYWYLYLEFIRRKPSLIDKYLHFIYKKMEWNDRDHGEGYIRQKSMFNVLFDLAKKQDELALLTISTLSIHWLTTVTWSGRHLTAHNFKTNDAEFIQIRKRIWVEIMPYFPALISPYTFFYGVVRDSSWILKTMYSFDGDFIQEIISKHLTPSILSHGIAVHKLFKKTKNDKWLKENASHFITDDVLLAEKLTLNSYGRKSDDREFILGEIKDVINWDDLFSSFQSIYRVSETILSLSADWAIPISVDRKLNALFDYMIDNDIQKFVRCIEYIINKNNSISYYPKVGLFQKLFEYDENLALEMHSILNQGKYLHREQCLIIYYSEIPIDKIQRIHYDTFVKLFEDRKEFLHLSFHTVKKFSAFEPNIILVIVNLIVKRVQEGANTVCLNSYFIEDTFKELVSEDADLAEKFYRALIPNNKFYDPNEVVVALLAKNRPLFIVELIQDHIEGRIDHDIDSGSFHFLFDNLIPKAEKHVHKIIDLYIKRNIYFDHNSEQVFGGLAPDSEQYKTALQMILNYIRKHSFNVERMRCVMQMVVKNFENDWIDAACEILAHDFPLAELYRLSFSPAVLINAATSRSEIASNQYQLILEKLKQSDLITSNSKRYYECENALNRLRSESIKSAKADKRRDFMRSRR